MGKVSRNCEVGGWVLSESIWSDTLLRALSEFLTWSRKSSYLTSWLVSLVHSCACSCSCGSNPAVRPQTGDKGWSFVKRVWKTIAPLLRPWCNEGEGPSVNVNPNGDSHSHVRWHSDDELLFGLSGESKLIVSLSLGARAFFDGDLVGLVRFV